MPAKRKRPTKSGGSAVRKRLKSKLSFESLPVEIIDQVLSYVLEDPRIFDWALHGGYNGSRIFVQPILQVSSTLRQRGFEITNNRCVWVCVACSGIEHIDRHREMPWLPEDFWDDNHHIPKGSPILRLTLDRDSSSSDRVSKMAWAELVPFNFSLFYTICQTILRQFSWVADGKEGILQIKFENFANDTSKEIHDLIMATLPFMLANPYTVLKHDDTTQLVKEIAINSRRRSEDLDGLAEKAMGILQLATSLKKAGQVDESAVMLLGCTWLMHRAEKLLPSVYPREADNGDNSVLTWDQLTNLPDQCVKGNLLRQTLFELENRACHAFIGLMDVYDILCYPLSFSDPDFRFLRGWSFSWLGLSMSHMAQLHFGRALLQDAMGLSQQDDKYEIGDDDDDDDSSYICPGLDYAGIEIKIALFLDPDNNTYQDLYKKYKSRRGPKWVKWVEKEAQARLTLVENNVGKVKDKKVIWAGDVEVMENWGAFEATRKWLPLAEKGLKAEPTFDEWFHTTVTPKKRKLYLQRSRRQEKQWDEAQERRFMTGPLW